MDYHKIYNSFIESRKNKHTCGYAENHHIIPRSLGGSDCKSNIVRLSAREHFIAHRLLAKIHGGKMWAALSYMSRSGVKSAKGVYVNSRVYELIKRKSSEWKSKAYSGVNSYWHGKKMPVNFKEKMRGQRPSIARENNPRYGKKLQFVGDVISFVKKRSTFDVDYTLMDVVNKNAGLFEGVNCRGVRRRIKTRELKRLFHYYQAMNIKRGDIFGSSNPNYGNGAEVLGEKNPMYGKTHSSEARKKISDKAKRRIECPFCGKVGSISNIKRWHFDKCKAA